MRFVASVCVLLLEPFDILIHGTVQDLCVFVSSQEMFAHKTKGATMAPEKEPLDIWVRGSYPPSLVSTLL